MSHIAEMYARYQKVTTRWTWSPESQRHDLEIDLGLLIKKRGYEVVRAEFDPWCERVAQGEAKGHIYGFLKHMEAFKPTTQNAQQQPSVALTACLGCKMAFTVLTEAGFCSRCDEELGACS